MKLTIGLVLLGLGLAVPWSVALAACEVDSVTVRKSQTHLDGIPTNDYTLEAYDATDSLLWTHPFQTRNTVDAVFLGESEDPPILVVGGRDEFLGFDCDGTLLETYTSAAEPSAYPTAGQFSTDGSSFVYVTFWRGEAGGIRLHVVPTSSWREVLVDPSPFEEWVRRLNGVDGPYDDRPAFAVTLLDDVVECSTAGWDRYGDYEWPLHYSYDVPSGTLLSHAWVHHFTVEDEYTCVARDADQALLWERSFPQPIVIARRSGIRSDWQGVLVLDGEGNLPPRYARLDAEGIEIDSTLLVEGSSTARIATVVDSLNINVCHGDLVHYWCHTIETIFMVYDPTREQTALFYIHLPTRGLYAGPTETIDVREMMWLGDVLLFLGRRTGAGDVLWIWHPDEPPDRSYVLSETFGTGVEETIVSFVEEGLNDHLEFVLTSGRSVWFQPVNYSFRPRSDCASYDVDGDADVDFDDLDALVDQILGIAELDAAAVCRADIDEFELADLTDAVRIHDRIASGGMNPSAPRIASPVAPELTATVVGAVRNGVQLTYDVVLESNVVLRAMRFALGDIPDATFVDVQIVDAEDASVARREDRTTVLLWPDARTRFTARITLASPDQESFPYQILLRALILAPAGLEIKYLDPMWVLLPDMTEDDDPPPPPPPPSLPERTALAHPVPNPFNAGTQLQFELDRERAVRIDIYDAAGRRVRGLVNSSLGAGRYEQPWDGRDDAGRLLSSGVYWARMRAEDLVFTEKLVLVK